MEPKEIQMRWEGSNFRMIDGYHSRHHSHGVNSRDFMRVKWILLHALDTISTIANSCLDQKSKMCLYIISRINLLPDADGHNCWKFDNIQQFFFQVRVTLITMQWQQTMVSHNLLKQKLHWCLTNAKSGKIEGYLKTMDGNLYHEALSWGKF